MAEEATNTDDDPAASGAATAVDRTPIDHPCEGTVQGRAERHPIDVRTA
jgi:hypothetical protein